jgi:rhomboid protease GluP
VDGDGGELLRTAPSRRRGEELALVLEALGIPYRLDRGEAGWELRVPWSERERALEALGAYEREPRRRRVPLPAHLTLLGVHVGVVLAAVAMVSGPSAADGVWFRAGSAKAAAILAGEPWRAVTALTLHANAEHLLGNVALGALVLGALGGMWGWGVATLLTVTAGAAGNLANAWLRGPPHDAIGASTAVFGAIGVLAGTGFVERARAVLGRPWITVAAALGLLGMLGAGEGTDILAHLFGMAAGLGLGAATALVAPRAPGRVVQAVAGALAVAAVAGAWLAAFARV